MQFVTPLIEGTLIKRYKRFLADVELSDGRVVVAHCPNTGAMTGCAEPGFKVFLCPNDDPKRKLKYTWEIAVDFDSYHIGINTHNANKLVAEALQNGVIAPLSGYKHIKREVRFGTENSKVDFLLSADTGESLYLEVKSVTLLKDGTGQFPDTVTARGQKHLRELTQLARSGQPAALLFCVQHTGIGEVQAAKSLDPTYHELLGNALEAGVQVMAWGCEISRESILLAQPLPFVHQ